LRPISLLTSTRTSSSMPRWSRSRKSAATMIERCGQHGTLSALTRPGGSTEIYRDKRVSSLKSDGITHNQLRDVWLQQVIQPGRPGAFKGDLLVSG
jgi:hypothetical protein